MRQDVNALQKFYDGPLGAVALKMALARLTALWPEGGGRDFLGLGYAGPYLEPYRASARRTVMLAPAAQGAERWPADGRALVCLGEDQRLPFMDAVFDRVILVHALEEAPAPRQMLREVWRVTAPEGRLVIITANRAGVWALADATPFGHGQPFSRAQLGALLRDNLFEPTATARALYAWPWSFGPALALANGLERAGETLWPALGGLLMMEAVKRLSIEPAAPRRQIVLARGRAAAGLRRTRK
jgi:SAM-dependent methyltransferase